MMVAIVKARNAAEEEPAPDNFDPKPFTPTPKKKKVKQEQLAVDASNPADDDGAKPSPQLVPGQEQVAPRATHDDEGLLLSTSLRPGGSKYQYVQFQEKASRF